MHVPPPPRTGRQCPCRWWFITGLCLGFAITFLFDEVARAQSYVQDGDSFVKDGLHYRLWGIDSPELKQTCDGKPVGEMAKRRLIELLQGRVDCQSKGTDRFGRTLAVCINHDLKISINQTLVAEGLAFNYDRYTSAYKADEGWGPVHQFHCMNPETWRHGK